MTFYHQQIIKIKKEIYLEEYLYEQVILAKQFIDTHFSENITLCDIAARACVSKFHFIRIFKLVYGNTPHQHLTSVRIEKAKEFLLKDKTIADACFLVGFNSVSSFKGLFKRYTNATPATFRQQKLKLNQDIPVTHATFLPFCFSLQKSNFEDSKQKCIPEICFSTT